MPRLISPLALIAYSLLTATVISDANAPCYDPSGEVTPGYYPCDPTAYITTCCPQGWTCFSSSLCIVTTHSNAFPNLTLGEVVRGTCTNPLWNDNVCGDYCLDGDDVDGEMVPCGKDLFCCGREYDKGECDCSIDGGAFVVEHGVAQTIVGVTDTSFSWSPTYATPTSTHRETTPTNLASVTTKKTTASSGSSKRSSSFGSSTRSSRTTTPTRSSTSSTRPTNGAVSSTPTPSNQPSTDSDPGDGKKALRIGLGVGIPLAVLALAGGLAGYIIWYRRRRQQSEANAVLAGSAFGTSDDLAENERADSPVLNRRPVGMTQNRAYE